MVSGLDFLANRKIPKVKLANDTVFTGNTLNFKYLAQDYKIFATGYKTKDKSDPSSFMVTNYKLFISTVKNGVALTDQLVNEKEFDGEMINIIFAGDIDGDGILDLIIDEELRNWAK